MLWNRYQCFHGWVDDIQPIPSGDGCLLKMHLANAQPILLTIFEPDWPLEPGNEVSIAVKRGKPSHAVALVDHTAGDGTILPQPGRSSRDDVAVVAALFLLALGMAGWKGLPVFTLTVALYWLATGWLPGVFRRREMGRISFLIDTGYRRWLEARDGG